MAMDGSTQSDWPAAMTMAGDGEGRGQLDDGRDGHGSFDVLRLRGWWAGGGAGGGPDAVADDDDDGDAERRGRATPTAPSMVRLPRTSQKAAKADLDEAADAPHPPRPRQRCVQLGAVGTPVRS